MKRFNLNFLQKEDTMENFSSLLDALEKSLNKNSDLLKGTNNTEYLLRDAIKTLRVVIKHKFSEKTISKTKKYGINIKEDFELSNLEYLALCIFIILPGDYMSTISILKKLECSLGGSFDLLKVLFDLYFKNCLTIAMEDEIGFKLSKYVREYSLDVKKPELKNPLLKTIIKDVDVIANLYNNMTNISKLAEFEINRIFNKYSGDYEYCKLMADLPKSNDLTDYSFIWYILGHLILTGTIISKHSDIINMWVESDTTRQHTIDRIFNDDDHFVFQSKIFERSIDEGGKTDKDSIEVSSDLKRKYLKGICREKRFESIIKPGDIKAQNLFYNEEIQTRVDELTKLLSVKEFTKIKKRLQKEGLRTGFACLFTGIPGSGKTSLCQSIAKKTGRDIVKVDMSVLRSKWWGEDEKNVKAIFTNYRDVMQESKTEPILLLNEADAIIGKRLNVEGHNGSIISSINATQNIILEELENFEGILIATTNLTQNFDSAFDRRFLYKIEFKNPDVDVKSKIWMSLAKIPEEWAIELANKFDFTGGNIENIYRKMITKKALYGDEITLDNIMTLCKEEKKDTINHIGFRV